MMKVKRIYDRGLQSERTYLSWHRTILLLLICILFVIRIGHDSQSTTILYSGVILAVLTFGFYISYLYRIAALEYKCDLTTESTVLIKKILATILFTASLLIFLTAMINLTQ